jgi:cell division protein FtsI (penicillin-binding protein 3)
VGAIANGGSLMKPYVVSEVRNSKQLPMLQTKPHIRRRVISSETAETLTHILEGVVLNGTGGKAAIPGYRVAGKTGTAQKIDPRTGAYSSSLLVGSFVGFVPADNPVLAMIVVIDEPRGEGWGGVVAAPVFRRVGEQALSYLGIPAEEPPRIAWAYSSIDR